VKLCDSKLIKLNYILYNKIQNKIELLTRATIAQVNTTIYPKVYAQSKCVYSKDARW